MPRIIFLYLAAAVSGAVLVASFEPVASPWAAWIFPLPLTLALWWLKPRLLHALGAGFILGLSFWSASIFWVTEVTWLGWIALGLYLSLFKALWLGVWGVLVMRLPDTMTSWVNIRTAFMGASAWTGLEWVRGNLFTGFPWNYLGVSQARLTGLIQVAEFGGVLLISWIMAFVALTLALTVIRLGLELRQKQRIRPHFEFTLSMLLVAGCFLYGLHAIRTERGLEKGGNSRLDYLAVQPNLPQDPWGEGVDAAEAISLMEILSRSGIAMTSEEEKRLIIWPETPIGREIVRHPAFRETREWLDQSGLSLLFGSNVYHPESAYNAAILIEPDQGVQYYFKNHLVIMGEYVPFDEVLPVLRRLVPLGVDFTPGTATTILQLRDPAVRIAPLICFEDVVGPHVRKMALKNPDCFINMTNDGWFNESPQSRQHLMNAVLRTVEFRRPMIRVTNNGVTAQIDEFGIIEKFIADPKSGKVQTQSTMASTLRLPPGKTTVYAQTGDWTGWGSLIATLIWIGWSQYSRRLSEKAE